MSEHEEEEGITLEEQVKILLEQNVPKEKIVEQIFEEDLNASVDTLSKLLDMGKLDIGRIKGRISRIKKRLAEKEKSKEEAPPGAAESLYKGELDVNGILNDILSKHPDINAKVKEEVMDWAQRKGGLQPTELVWILQSMRGITSTTANIIGAKYSFALNKALQEGKLQLPPAAVGIVAPQLSNQPQFMFPQPLTIQPQPQPGQQTQPPAGLQFSQPYGYGYGYPPTPPAPQDVRSMIREELRLIEERKPKEPMSEQYVDIYEPVKNKEDQVIVNEAGQPVMRHIHVPANQAVQFTPKEDAEARFLQKMKDYKDLFGSKEELTIEKIRTLIREEAPHPTAQPEKSITIEDVQKASTEAATTAAQQVIEAQKKEDKEERRHKEVIEAIQQTASSKTVEGYKDDSFRILGQGLTEAAGAIKERKPVEVLIREGGPLVLGVPPGKEVEAGAGTGLFERLRKRGWVTEQ